MTNLSDDLTRAREAVERAQSAAKKAWDDADDAVERARRISNRLERAEIAELAARSKFVPKHSTHPWVLEWWDDQRWFARYCQDPLRTPQEYARTVSKHQKWQRILLDDMERVGLLRPDGYGPRYVHGHPAHFEPPGGYGDLHSLRTPSRHPRTEIKDEPQSDEGKKRKHSGLLEGEVQQLQQGNVGSERNDGEQQQQSQKKKRPRGHRQRGSAAKRKRLQGTQKDGTVEGKQNVNSNMEDGEDKSNGIVIMEDAEDKENSSPTRANTDDPRVPVPASGDHDSFDWLFTSTP